MKKQKTVALLLALILALMSFGESAEAVPQSNGSASVVVGQATLDGGLRDGGGSVAANVLSEPWDTFYDGTRFFVVDTSNHRVLIYNSIPTSANQSADVVVGQQNMEDHTYNQGLGDVPTARTLNYPSSVFSDGTRLFIADHSNHRILIFNTIPTSNNAAADIVIGQPNMSGWQVNAGVARSAKTLNYPDGIYVAGGKLFVADPNNNRVLIWNSVPTSDYTAANVVVGQINMTDGTLDQGGPAGANTLDAPTDVYSDGTRLFIADYNNNRVLLFNSIPVSANASANAVIGQANASSTTANQGGSVGANTLSHPWGIASDGSNLLVADSANNRVLIYNAFPTAHNASANSVVGKSSMTSGAQDPAAGNSLYDPQGIHVLGSKLAVADRDNHRVMIYTLRPTLAEVSAASTTSFTPSYTFSSDEDGTLTAGGSCSTTATSAAAGNNTIIFNALAAGTYSDCVLAVTNGAGFTSATLAVSPFTLSRYADSLLTLTPASLPYAKKKSKSRRETLIIQKFNLAKKAKKSWASVRVNGRKMKVSSVKNSGANLRIRFKLVYGKWAQGNYTLVMSYKNKVNNAWETGAFTGDNIFTVY